MKDAHLNHAMQSIIKSFKSSSSKIIDIESKRHLFTKEFKLLSDVERVSFCASLVDIIKVRVAADTPIDDILTTLCFGIASECDSTSIKIFLDNLLEQVSDSGAIKEVAICLLDIIDSNLCNDKNAVPLGQTALVVLTELGLMLANHTGNSILDSKGSAAVVEYITTSLLARSNINSSALRISLVQYLARCPMSQHSSQHLNRVISRFGQSLLDDLFKAYFDNSGGSNAAFHFLVQYLNVFFIASPVLAEMSHNVLKHYLLKYPNEFSIFLGDYCERMPREELRLIATTRHVALLFKASLDICKRELAESISAILVKHISLFKDVSIELMAQQINLAQDLVRPKNKISSVLIVWEEFFMSTQALLLAKSNSYNAKVIPILRSKKARKLSPLGREFKISEEPTSLETVLALAS